MTARKQAEIQQLNQQLTARVNELQTLLNVLPIGVAISEDPECRVARVNPSLSKMLRVEIDANASPSAPNSERPAYQVYRDGQKVSDENLPMQYAATHNLEARDEVVDIVHPDGTVIQLLGYASPLRDEQGGVRGVIGGFVDITERKQIEEALRASEARFRRAFDDAPIGIALVSIEGRFLKVNRSLCDILKYSEAELLTQSLQDITHADNVQTYLTTMQQLLADEIQTFQTEERYLQKQGNIVQGALSVSLVRDQENQPLYFIAQIQDISDRSQVERMKDEFISVVSHELRTPLTSIRGALGILESGVFDDRPQKAHHMLQVALNNSDRLVRLVDDILTLERLASGKVPLVMERCQVTDLMQQAINSVQTLADRDGVTLCLTPLAATLWAAPDAIIQALTNLLGNAIKFSSMGDTVWLKAEKVAEISNHRVASDLFEIPKGRSTPNQLPASSILFMVKDQGRGIPEDKLEVIFGEFQQVDVSDSREKGGTGLGLAISKQIVQQHNGQIWVESCLGQGSTFYFALPLIVKDDS
ncbi:PAS domain-containing sensor histidine kinase [Phormidesmis priestleyi]